MERPDMPPQVQEGGRRILLGRSQDLQEAQRLALERRMQGYRTWIESKGMGSVMLYEVWGVRDPIVLTADE